MGTDGLWDVLENATVAKIVFDTLKKYPSEKHRYTMVAQELVAKSRGRANDSGHWRLADLKHPATVDDISVIVIPVYYYFKEFFQWENKFLEAMNQREETRIQGIAMAKTISDAKNTSEVDEEVEEATEEDNDDDDNDVDDDDDDDDEEEETTISSFSNNNVAKSIERINLNDRKDGEPDESTA